MKYLFYLYIILLIPNLSIGQERVYLDVNKKVIDENSFLTKWRNRGNMLSRWDSIGKNKKRYAILKKNMYEIGVSNYELLKKELEKIISKKVPDNVTILLSYRYKDDLCSRTTDNYWTRGEINRRKRFLKPWLKKFKKDNIYYIWLFQNGIRLNTKSGLKDEFFYLDKNNFFKEKIFISKTLCGSAAIITKQGEILVRNGEGSMMSLYNHLVSEEIPLFFKN